MIILAPSGPVDAAWLDASGVDPGYHGLRCRLVVNDQGGVACDRIEGDRDLSPAEAHRLAAHAVAMTDPSDEEALRLDDGTGLPARLVRDDAVRAPDRDLMAAPTSALSAEPPSFPSLRYALVLTATAACVGIGIALSVALSEHFPMTPLVVGVVVGMLVNSVAHAALATRRRHGAALADHRRLTREIARRAMAPSTVVRTDAA